MTKHAIFSKFAYFAFRMGGRSDPPNAFIYEWGLLGYLLQGSPQLFTKNGGGLGGGSLKTLHDKTCNFFQICIFCLQKLAPLPVLFQKPISNCPLYPC